MPRPEPTLVVLASQLARCADDALLDAPLDRLGGRAGARASELLRELAETGEARTLRDLLDEETLTRWAEDAATPSEVAALRAQLRRWLGAGHVGDDDPARLARVPEPPEDVDALLAWAKAHGVKGELGRPAREALGGHEDMGDDASVLERCVATPATSGRSLLERAHLRDEARAHLVREAKANGAASAREALWARPIPSATLLPLAARLRGVIGDAGLVALNAVRFVPARLVTLDDETAIARGAIHAGEGPAFTVSLFLSGFEDRAIDTTCERCTLRPCLHVQALAARLLDACHDADDRLHRALVALVAEPSWRRFLRAIAAEPQAATGQAARADETRLRFRVRVVGEKVTVAVVARRRTAAGTWSAGKVLAPGKAARAATDPRDRTLLEAMARASRTAAAQPVAADLAMLRALVEHPEIELEGTREAPSITEERLVVTMVELPAGLRPRVSLAGAELAPGPRPRELDHVIRFEPGRGVLVFAALTPELRRLLEALASFRGVLPEASHAALAPFLAALGKVARVEAPQSLRGTAREVPRKLRLRIVPGHDEGIDVTLAMRPLPTSALFPPGLGPEICHGLEDGVAVYARRDLAAERALAEQVIAALDLRRHLRLEPFAYRIESRQDALDVLGAAARLVDALEIDWAETRARITISTTVRASDLAVRLFKKGDWLEIEGGAHRPDVDIAFGKLLDAARRGERYVQVRGDDYLEIERTLFERLELAQLCTHARARVTSLSTAAAPAFLELFGERTLAGDARTALYVDHATATEDVALPELGAALRPYQRDGVRWLLTRSRFAPGACLADEMGLGKTAQAIALLEARAGDGPALVVAPTSVVDNWLTELARFGRTLEGSAYRGASRGALLDGLGPRRVLVTSYELLVRDAARFEGVRFATQIIDEAQLVKNARTRRAQVVAGIDAGFRLALSGTPVENRLGDLWSLFHLVAPGLLGSWARFRSLFAVPIERYADEARASALRALVAPLVLRRTKREVAPELPPRTEVVHTVALSEVERSLYDAALRQARKAIGRRRRDDAARTAQILAELTRLRQLACHPRLVLEDERMTSSKLAAFLELVDDVVPRGHRLLVFSQFTRHLALVREALAARGISSLYLDGATPGRERMALVERFQAGEARLFLISLKAGGAGLNLTAADYVVHLDPWWNPAAEDQASDRAHRIGQTSPVTIVKLVALDTIEEKVLALHAEKRRLAAAAVDDDVLAAGALDTTALEALLALG